MITHAFTHGNATVTVRQRNGWDTLDSMVVMRKLAEAGVFAADDITRNRITQFTTALLQTASVEGDLGLGVKWASPNDPADAIKHVYDAYGNDATLVIRYVIALNKVEEYSLDSEAAVTAPNAEAPNTP